MVSPGLGVGDAVHAAVTPSTIRNRPTPLRPLTPSEVMGDLDTGREVEHGLARAARVGEIVACFAQRVCVRV